MYVSSTAVAHCWTNGGVGSAKGPVEGTSDGAPEDFEDGILVGVTEGKAERSTVVVVVSGSTVVVISGSSVVVVAIVSSKSATSLGHSASLLLSLEANVEY
jgi:hypothetical protein